MKNNRDILLDYYSGAYGPTLRIGVPSIEALKRLEELFLKLAETNGHVADFARLNNVRVLGLDHFLLCSTPNTPESEKKLKRVSSDMTKPGFEWAMSPNEWKRVASLIGSLLEKKSPGHQYLTKEGVDDALVELAFRE